jgi:predicted nuclease of predicted toxin-antitoxin system
MRLLIDECVPSPLKKEFSVHDVQTVQNMGWAGKKNGELLQLMTAAGFEVLVTVDQNLKHQQNLEESGIAVLVLVASTNHLADLTSLVPAAEAALTTIEPGDVVEITA